MSNVSGQNLDLLRMFLNLLPVRSFAHEEDPAEFQIDDTYWVNVSVCCITRHSSDDNSRVSVPYAVAHVCAA